MNKLLFTLCALTIWSLGLNAQIQTPAASPAASVYQKVGLTDIKIEYSRPSQKGRELFVDVESFGKKWRTGANGASKITFSDDVKVEGHDVPAGTYAIYSVPGKEEFTVMIYKDTKIGGNMAKYDEAMEHCKFKVKTQMLPMSFENFTFVFNDVTANSAHIGFMWGKYYVPFKVTTIVDEVVMETIDKVMAGPSKGDYYTAASYYYSNDKDMNKALKWIQMANEGDKKKFWQVRMESLILAKLGKYGEAIKTAEMSKSLAMEAKNDGYVKMNTVSIKEWMAKK